MMNVSKTLRTVWILASIIRIVSSAESNWWLLSIPTYDPRQNQTTYCNSLGPSLTSNEREFCLKYPSIMHKISDGIRLGIKECKYSFRYNRWNCSTYEGPARRHAFAPLLKSKGREQAYVQAILAAAVSYELTKTCTKGLLPTSVCSTKNGMFLSDSGFEPPPPRSQRPRRPKEDKGKVYYDARLSDNVKVGDNLASEFFKDTRKSLLGALDRHNYKAGRVAVTNSITRKCKCHGLSGSCTLIACWDTMRPLREISQQLKGRYDNALLVRGRTRKGTTKLRPRGRGSKKLNETFLVYAAKREQDYCEKNLAVGSYGTKDRWCSAGADANNGSCEHLCCNRGYKDTVVVVKKPCECMFRWCCTLNCEVCDTTFPGWICR